MADVFSNYDARNLLQDKFVLMFGDSNMRSIYKDLVFLLVEGCIAPARVFRRGGRQGSFCGDVLIDASKNETAGRNFFEIREYKDEEVRVRYNFITRVFSAIVKKELRAIEEGNLPVPDVVLINSCLWDITRWGSRKEEQYKEEVAELLGELHRLLPPPRTLIIWTSTMPVATERVKGGVFIKQLEFMKHSMRFMILEANKFAEQACKCFNVDLLDLHYHMRYQLHRRTNDGLHWEPPALRHIINIILTHIALSWEEPLPGNIIGDSVRVAQATAEDASMENKGEVLLDQQILSHIQNVKKRNNISDKKESVAMEKCETKESEGRRQYTRARRERPARKENNNDRRPHARTSSNHFPTDDRKVSSHSNGNFSVTVGQSSSQDWEGSQASSHFSHGGQRNDVERSRREGENNRRGEREIGRSQVDIDRSTTRRVAGQCYMNEVSNVFNQQGYNMQHLPQHHLPQQSMTQQQQQQYWPQQQQQHWPQQQQHWPQQHQPQQQQQQHHQHRQQQPQHKQHRPQQQQHKAQQQHQHKPQQQQQHKPHQQHQHKPQQQHEPQQQQHRPQQQQKQPPKQQHQQQQNRPSQQSLPQPALIPQLQPRHGGNFNWNGYYSFASIPSTPFWQNYPTKNFPWNKRQ